MSVIINLFLKNSSTRLFLLVVMIFLLAGCSQERPEEIHTFKHDKANPFRGLDFSAIQSGDIILKRGKGNISRMIVEKLAEPVPISHCGILVRDNDSVYIIHSVAKELTGIDGVQRVGFDVFMRDCLKNYLYVVRPKSDSVKRERIAVIAGEFLSRKATFDYELNYKDSSRVNCSELVYWALLRSTGSDLFKRIKMGDQYPLAFNSLLDTCHFDVIYRY